MATVLLSSTLSYGTGFTIGSDKLTATTNTYNDVVYADTPIKDGKKYWEVEVQTGLNANNTEYIGIGKLATSGNIGTRTDILVYYADRGVLYPNNVTYGSTFDVGDVIGVAFDADNGLITFYKNGVSQGEVLTNINAGEDIYPIYSSYYSNTVKFNFGSQDFKFSTPSGYEQVDGVNKTLILLNNGEYKKLVKGSDAENAIPAMTSNTTPSGIASASSNNGTDYSAWKAFDGNKTTSGNYWQTPINNPTGWLKYDFGVSNKKIIKSYNITGAVHTADLKARYPRDWTFEGSNDDITWTVLDTRTGVSWIQNETKSFNTSNTVEYQMYKINVTANNGDTYYLGIGELEMISADMPDTWQTVTTSTPTKTDFETHGHEDLSIIPDTAWNELASTSPSIELVTYVPTGNTANSFTETYLDMQRNVNMNALPIGQILLSEDELVSGDIKQLIVNKVASTEEGIIKTIVSFDSGATWETFKDNVWTLVNPTVISEVQLNGMTVDELSSISQSELQSKLVNGTVNLGYYLEESVHFEESAKIESSQVVGLASLKSVELSDMAFYILNTTATINLTFSGNRLTGQLDDADLGKVKYRVWLNGAPYYPQDGKFTKLQPSPHTINLNISDDQLNFGVANTLTVEFEDYWGNTDQWTSQFIGTYSGLMFMDELGDFYSSNFGDVLKYLDFGTIVAGQTSIDQKVILKNQIGYAVQNTSIEIIQPSTNGAVIEISKQQSPFLPEATLMYPAVLNPDDQIEFFVRIKTDINSTPTNAGQFEIRTKADRV